MSNHARAESPAGGDDVKDLSSGSDVSSGSGISSASDVSIDATPRAATRFFILPAIVTAVIVSILGVYFLFGALTRDTRSAESYLVEVRTGQGNRRWQAAYELSRLLESGEAKVRADTAAQAVAAFRETVASSDDPRVRRYLTLTLGRLRDPSAVPELVKVLTDPDAETRIYAALALGEIGDRRAVGPLGGALGDEDAGVRKSAAYALGLLADPSSCTPLREALHDREIDVTWNSAVALARIGDPTGAEVLRSMADREFVERASQSEDPATRSTVLITAVKALVLIEDRASLPALRKLAGTDPDLRVRQAAIDGLKKLEEPAQS